MTLMLALFTFLLREVWKYRILNPMKEREIERDAQSKEFRKLRKSIVLLNRNLQRQRFIITGLAAQIRNHHEWVSMVPKMKDDLNEFYSRIKVLEKHSDT